MDKTKWPLAVSTFTVLDKLKISAFLFREPVWTYGAWVRDYEKMWEKEFECNNAIMVSSGSAANELIALRRKWELQSKGEWPRRNKVIFPVNTWISSVSVWINVGFEPVFVDVDEYNLNAQACAIDYAFQNDAKKSIGTVFYTALLGFFNDLDTCKLVTEKYGAKFLMDNCEASFSYYKGNSILKFAPCSTSIFFSHLTMSGTEGGLIFTQNEEEAEWYRMARSHGMTRGMPFKYKNPNVNSDFDFYLMGSNYRSSNLQAYMASLDFERAVKYSKKSRFKIFKSFNNYIDTSKYIHFSTYSFSLLSVRFIPLAIPILCKTKEQRIRVETYLKIHKIMYRPLIAGCLLAHTAFKDYGKMDDFPVAKWSHECALYIGLHKNVTPEMATNLAQRLNEL